MKKLLLLLLLIPNLVMADTRSENYKILPLIEETSYRSCKMTDVSQICETSGVCAEWFFQEKGYSDADYKIFLQEHPELNIPSKTSTFADVKLVKLSRSSRGMDLYIDFLDSEIKIKLKNNTFLGKRKHFCVSSCGCFDASIKGGRRNIYERDGFCVEDSIQTNESFTEILVKRNITIALEDNTRKVFDEESKEQKKESKAYSGLCKEVNKETYLVNLEEKSINFLKRSGGWQGWKQKSGYGYRFAEQYGIQDMRSSSEHFTQRIDFTFSKKHGWLMYLTTSFITEEHDKIILIIDEKKFVFHGQGTFHKQEFTLNDEIIKHLKSTKNDFYIHEIYKDSVTYRTVFKSEGLRNALEWVGK